MAESVGAAAPVPLAIAPANRHVVGTIRICAGAELSLPTATSYYLAETSTLPRADARPVAIWLLACCGLIFGMVVIGGITRLTWSGLSITEWQPVTGIVPPLSEAAWQAEFAKYQQIPQYKLLNSGMGLADFRYIYLWEYVHRLWGRLIGFAYALPLVYFLIRRQIPRRLTAPLIGIFVLGGAQGALGWYMVKSGLADRIEVSQYRLTAHLVLALAIYALTLWIALGLLAESSVAAQTSGNRSPPTPASGAAAPACWRRASELLIALVALTITAGGFVAGLNAGLTYNTFPLMDGRLVPAGYARLEPFVRNWFENVPAVQFDHRLLAETTVTAIVVVWLIGRRALLPHRARRALHALGGVALGQFTLGVSTLLLVVPVPVAALHQAGAVILLTTAIVWRHTLRASRVGDVPVIA
ncbi:MAG: COX15/CtaA family protein [Alphaproteobacteria bacterium]|nr:COX15/CtaA family protein [Alphaproteobacteria bacterium]